MQWIYRKILNHKLTKLGIDCTRLSKEEFYSLDEKASEKFKRIIQPNDHIVVTSAVTLSKSSVGVQESIKMEVAQNLRRYSLQTHKMQGRIRRVRTDKATQYFADSRVIS